MPATKGRPPNVALRNKSPDEWPEMLEPHDLAGILNRSYETVRRNMRAGRYGKVIVLAGRRYIRRSVFLRALEARSVDFGPARPLRLRSKPGRTGPHRRAP